MSRIVSIWGKKNIPTKLIEFTRKYVVLYQSEADSDSGRAKQQIKSWNLKLVFAFRITWKVSTAIILKVHRIEEKWSCTLSKGAEKDVKKNSRAAERQRSERNKTIGWNFFWKYESRFWRRRLCIFSAMKKVVVFEVFSSKNIKHTEWKRYECGNKSSNSWCSF